MSLIEDIVLVYNRTFSAYRAAILSNKILLDSQFPMTNGGDLEYTTYELLHVCEPAKLAAFLKGRDKFDWEHVCISKLIGGIYRSDRGNIICDTCKENIPQSYYTALMLYKNKDNLKL